VKISKGNVRNINKRILAGTIAFTFLATKLLGYKVVKYIKYSHAKSGYIQTENIDVIIPKDYAIIPEKTELSFISDFNVSKDNYKKNKVNQLIGKGKIKVLNRRFK
jgi:3-phosphoglycerate kinase